ncbi:MAG: Nif3-like dinuclear metal center hexameric protein [Clostridia bacterium]
MKIDDIIDKIEEFAPLSVSEEAIANGEFDNSGFLVGDSTEELTGVVVCIDVCFEAVELAKKNKCNLILSHHPFIYQPIGSVTGNDFKGRLLKILIQNDIAVYSSHLCMDMTVGGIDDTIADMCGIKVEKVSEELSFGGYGKFGKVEKTDFKSYVAKIKKVFDTVGVAENRNKVEKVVSFCGGGVSDTEVKFAIENGADVVISCDIPHHHTLELCENKINVIELSHGESELKALWKIIGSLNLETKLVLCQKDFRFIAK